MKKPLLLLFLFIFLNCHSQQSLYIQDTPPLTVFKQDLSANKRMPLIPIKFSTCVSIVAAGDIMIGNHTLPYLDKYGYAYPFQATASILQSGDMAFANLESPFTENGTPFEKKFTFKVHPKYVSGLIDAGIDVVTLANNHILDFGLEGLANTIATLDSAGILFCGAGMAKQDAQAPAIFKTNGFRIAVLGYSMTFPEEFWASDTSGGTNYPYEKNLERSIQQCNSIADFTVVTFHWGRESTFFPKEYQKRFAHRSIDLGADLVLGHHPHVLQGLEIYKNRLIAYSLGNYAFSSYSTKATESMILKTFLNEDGLFYAKIFPMCVDNYKIDFQPKIVTGAKADTILAHLRSYSQATDSNLVIDDNGYIWKNTLLSQNKENSTNISVNATKE